MPTFIYNGHLSDILKICLCSPFVCPYLRFKRSQLVSSLLSGVGGAPFIHLFISLYLLEQ